MKLIRTITIKLEEPRSTFQPTVEKYTQAFNLVCKTGFKDGDKNGVSLHKKTYCETREYLPSQLAISARVKATEALKSVCARIKKGKKASCPVSKQCSIRYDDRSSTIWFERNEVSLLTISGRKKFAIKVPECFKKYLSWKRCSCDLVLRPNGIFLKIVMSVDIENPVLNNKFYGIDRGINNLAVVSNNKFYRGGKIKHISKRYERLRSDLQSRGTRSAQRHLSKISRKEKRFRTDVNHCVSKAIVSQIEPNSTIVLEKLTGIRKSADGFRKEEKKQVNKWNFFQFEQFLTYKAMSRGISIVHVSPRNTSITCSSCGHVEKSNRIQSIFKCKHCSFSLHADLNASRFLVQKHLDAIGHPDWAAINQPYVRQSQIGLSNPPASAGGC